LEETFSENKIVPQAFWGGGDHCLFTLCHDATATGDRVSADDTGLYLQRYSHSNNKRHSISLQRLIVHILSDVAFNTRRTICFLCETVTCNPLSSVYVHCSQHIPSIIL